MTRKVRGNFESPGRGEEGRNAFSTCTYDLEKKRLIRSQSEKISGGNRRKKGKEEGNPAT